MMTYFNKGVCTHGKCDRILALCSLITRQTRVMAGVGSKNLQGYFSDGEAKLLLI